MALPWLLTRKPRGLVAILFLAPLQYCFSAHCNTVAVCIANVFVSC